MSMDSLPQTLLFILTLVCGLSCGLLILAGLALYVLGRLDIVRDLLSGLRSAARDDDETLGQQGLYGEHGAVVRSRHRSDVSQRVAEARSRADREFQGGSGEASPSGEASHLPDYPVLPDRSESSDKARYKRRFREENPDLDDEVDSYFDDTEL
jgi:hypothetical protein